MTFNIYVPSYKRSESILTNKVLEYCTYVVRKSEEEKYIAAGVNCISAPDEEVGCIADVINWIYDNSPEEVIAILDDDIEKLVYRSHENTVIEDPVEATIEIERIAQLIYDLNIGYAATPNDVNPKFFSREFKFVGVTGQVKWFNKKACKARWNNITYLSDIDFELQELLKNRIILIPNYFSQIASIDVNTGGSNDTKTLKQWYVANETMSNKWGRYYKKSEDNNPGGLNVKR